jgi:hypothetical protein
VFFHGIHDWRPTWEQTNSAGPDLAQGVPTDQFTDGGMLVGHVGDEAVLLAMTSTPSARSAPTTAARLRTGSSPGTR